MVVLIADDEKMARITLKLMLTDLNIPSLNILESSNGEDFLTKVEHYKPEIAFVDINMPIINGLEAIERAKQSSPDTVYTIVTGYSEFDFARKAIELKVDNYLLKPVDTAALEKVVSNSVVLHSQKCFELNKNFERLIIAKSHNMESLDFLDLNHCFDHILPISKSMIFVFDSRNRDSLKTLKGEFFTKLRKIAESYISKELLIAVFNISSEMLCILCSTNENLQDRADSYFMECKKLDRKTSPDVMISCFKNKFLSSDINTQYFHMIELSLLRIIYRDTSRHDLSHYWADENKDVYLGICQMLNTLCINFNQKNFTGFHSIIDRLKNDKIFLSLLENDITRQNITEFIRIHTGFVTDGNINGSEQWLGKVVEYGNSLLASKNISRKYIDEVMEYVELNYMNDIGINTIAEYLNITPNYLSRIFHKETKLKFTDYIANTRISHAKKLLLETPYTIRDISNKVGYRSTRHFTNLFVKYTGDYPSKYRKEPVIAERDHRVDN